MGYKNKEDAQWYNFCYDNTAQAKTTAKIYNNRPNIKARKKIYYKKYGEEHKEEISIQKKTYYQTHKEAKKKYMREYRLRKKNEKINKNA